VLGNIKIRREETALDETTVREACIELLETEGIPLLPERLALLDRHAALVREWNAHTSLVSRGDVDHIWRAHLADSLSLAGAVLRTAGPTARYVDIGSGAGFPGITLKAVLPGLQVTLIERSVKRSAFLRKVLGALRLGDVRLVTAEFPREVGLEDAEVITARAVENPTRVVRAIAVAIPREAVYLCQSGNPRDRVPTTFHVEQIEDTWTRRGIRRGSLFLVRQP